VTAPVTTTDSSTPSPTQSQTSTIHGDLGAGISTGSIVPFSDLVLSGGVAGGLGLMITLAFLYAIIICRRKRKLSTTRTNSSSSSPSSSFSVVNPLKELRERPLAPRSRPPKGSHKSYSDTVK
jgi:hypothetical protein